MDFEEDNIKKTKSSLQPPLKSDFLNLWDLIINNLILKYGETEICNWFTKVTIENIKIINNKKTIIFKAENDFIKQYVQKKYLHFIEDFLQRNNQTKDFSCEIAVLNKKN